MVYLCHKHNKRRSVISHNKPIQNSEFRSFHEVKSALFPHLFSLFCVLKPVLSAETDWKAFVLGVEKPHLWLSSGPPYQLTPALLSLVHEGQIGRALVPTSAAVKQITIVLTGDSILLQRSTLIIYPLKRAFCASLLSDIAFFPPFVLRDFVVSSSRPRVSYFLFFIFHLVLF